jgi:EAL domain-containing protein (putative c-di-GMP-specific phosphodiesterase class I)
MCNQKSTSEKDRQYIEHMEKDITKIDKVLIKAKQKKTKSHCQYNIIVSLCKVMQQ